MPAAHSTSTTKRQSDGKWQGECSCGASSAWGTESAALNWCSAHMRAMNR